MSKQRRWCKGDHAGASCYKVKAIEYFANGKIKRVEFCDPMQPLKIITQEYVQPTQPLPPWPTYPFFYPTITCGDVVSGTCAKPFLGSSYTPTIQGAVQ